ncbi:zinc finger protein 704 [Rhincodon typus]|uniref:zinc finger protein 704 n=1 Tax=Rhincodon typus TaxID=259920 RepID=UPI00202FAC4C|nr:zinc finger protein 704 [Rhincodon typus]
MELVKEYYDAKPALIPRHYRFYLAVREPGKPASGFSTKLRRLAEACDFGLTLNEMRDRLVQGFGSQLEQELRAGDDLGVRQERSVVYLFTSSIDKTKIRRQNHKVNTNVYLFSPSRRSVDSDCSDGEEDFYYQEIKLNTDSVAEGLGSLSPVSPSVASPPVPCSLDAGRSDARVTKTEAKPATPLSRSAPTCLYLIHTDHAYQATAPVNIPGSKFTPTSNGFSISWQSPPVTFTGMPVSPTHSHPVEIGDQRQQTLPSLSSPPRPVVGARKTRGEGKKCRKVYGMENRDMWCTACRWKKACQRFID